MPNIETSAATRNTEEQLVGWQFDPKPDITAREVAVCINTALGGGEFAKLPEGCKRHFKPRYAPKRKWWKLF